MLNQPKGLIAAACANMGERFGFYVMMAILSLFLMSKFGLNNTDATIIFSIFYTLIYLLALVGGYIADRMKNRKTPILIGLLMMAVGYLIIAYPTPTPVTNLPVSLTITCVGLLVIALGNGLFKGNLQALVGQMYDNKEYSSKRDTGFQIFYMFINLGAIFSPLMAVAVRNWWLAANDFKYNPDLPALCHQFLGNKITPEAQARMTELANDVSTNVAPENLTTFAESYLNVFNSGYHYAFGVAIIAMLLSLVVYLVNKNQFPNMVDAKKKVDNTEVEVEMDVAEVRQRIYALFAVFAVVIFFWFSFHQTGTTLSFFARDYINLDAININLGFVHLIGAELFQSVNPFFVVFLTPVIVAISAWQNSRGTEFSTPKKIAMGMGIAGLAYVVMTIGSMHLPDYETITASGGLASAMRVTPMLLIATYFILTVAELYISPLGIAFVSKVAPPQYQGLMQGCWLGATALGNQLLIIGAIFYEHLPLWATWTLFVVACLISMFMMLAMLKWLEGITNEKKTKVISK